MLTFDFDGVSPQVDPAAWVAPTATLIGHVVLHDRSSVFYGAVHHDVVLNIASGT